MLMNWSRQFAEQDYTSSLPRKLWRSRGRRTWIHCYSWCWIAMSSRSSIGGLSTALFAWACQNGMSRSYLARGAFRCRYRRLLRQCSNPLFNSSRNCYASDARFADIFLLELKEMLTSLATQEKTPTHPRRRPDEDLRK